MDNIKFSSTPVLQGVFALLDDTKALDGSQSSYLFSDPIEQIVARTAEDIPQVLDAIDKYRRNGNYLCGYISYETGYHIIDKRKFNFSKVTSSTLPFVQFFVFTQRKLLTKGEVDCLINNEVLGQLCAVYDFTMSESKERYLFNIEKIRQYILDGDTYQVNHTLKYHFKYEGTPLSLYRELRQRQSVEYGAFINFPEVRILSLSPELFIRKKDIEIESKPMKGTAPRGETAFEDGEILKAFKTDPKTLSENVMIVDLIRNDIGRIADDESVEVKNLFEVQTFKTVHQMVSTIKGKVSADISFKEVIKKLFPCGSITGAPKIRTMEIIEEIEAEPRGVYTGAIGFISPDNDFCFNVPIRTIVSTRPTYAEMGIGSGIIYEANAEDEFKECLLKAKFLTGINEKFQLIETMCFYKNINQIQNFPFHMARLKRSAEIFGFRININYVLEAINKALLSAKDDQSKIRLLLWLDGKIEISVSPLISVSSAEHWLDISSDPVNSSSIFQNHKTTVRAPYELAYQRAVEQGAYDVLFLNEHNKIAEASRHNVFVEKNKRLFTPPISSGALPGVFRQVILQDPLYKASELELTMNDLITADKIYLSNSLRGLVEVKLRNTYGFQTNDMDKYNAVLN